ncbi:MAG: hypothetical protein ABR526_00460 [Chthoniobacterales bacterium]
MIRALLVAIVLLLGGAAKLPLEHQFAGQRKQLHLQAPELNLGVREQIGQLGFVAALSGFRSLVADVLFIQAHVAWERTEWSRVLLLFRQVTMLEPHVLLFWDMAAWHMAWNASAAAINDPQQPRLTLRVKAQRDYFDAGREFLERGIANNPDKPQLFEALGRLYRDKYRDHARASEFFDLTASKAGAPSYARRFAAYELSYCDGREQDAHSRLRQLYDIGERERLPTLIKRLKFLEDKLNIPLGQRIPESSG